MSWQRRQLLRDCLVGQEICGALCVWCVDVRMQQGVVKTCGYYILYTGPTLSGFKVYVWPTDIVCPSDASMYFHWRKLVARDYA